MTHEFHIIDLADTGQVQLSIVDGDRLTEGEPTEFSVALQGSDRQELDWYFLDSPTGEPDPNRSQAVETGLSNLGRLLFESVFASGEQAQTAYDQAKTQGLAEYGMVVISQRPQFLELPWELMNEPEAGSSLPNSNGWCAAPPQTPCPPTLGLPKTLTKISGSTCYWCRRFRTKTNPPVKR